MTDQVASPGGAPAAPDAGAAPAAPAAASAPATRPEYLPEAFWDPQANTIKHEDFGKHYAEVATFHKTQTDAQAALAARKPEDIKIEVKLPETVKVPDGFKVAIDEKDPVVQQFRALAHDAKLPQDVVEKLVAFDAQKKIADYNAEVARVAEENKKLGANGDARKTAVANWTKGLLDSKSITAEEHDELAQTASSAAGVSLLEKIMAKANGGVPGHVPNPQTVPKPADIPIEQRWYGGSQPQKAG